MVKNLYQKRLFCKSEVLGDGRANEKQRKFRLEIQAKESKGWSQEQIQAFTADDAPKIRRLLPEQLNLIKPEQVELVSRERIPDLNKPELIQKIPQKYAAYMQPEQMPHIQSDQVAWFEGSVTKTQAIDPGLCTHMTDKQLKNLSLPQVGKIQDEHVKKRIAKVKPALLIQPMATAAPSESPALDEEVVVVSQEPQPQVQGPSKTMAHTPIRPPSITPVGAVEETRSVTQVVLCVLVGLVATGAALCGVFALVGALYPHAPQFTIIIYHAFQSPLFMPCVAAGGGTLILVGLITYAIDQCCRGKKPVHSIKPKVNAQA